MVGEAPLERFAERGDLLAQRSLGELGQDLGVMGAGDQRVEHLAGGHAEHLGGDRGELDPGVLQGLLDTLHLAGAFLDLCLAVADQVTQFPQRPGRHEARPDEPVLDQLTAPLGILDVAFASGDVAQVASVVEPALEFALEQVEHRAPVHAGGLHPDDGHHPATQPVGEQQQPGRRALKLADLLPAPAVTIGNPHARGDLRLVDVEHRAPLDQTIHSNPPEGRMTGRPPGRASCCGV
jgi:hypothetical protein